MFKYKDGTIQVSEMGSLYFKGIRNEAGSRPYYILIKCNMDESFFSTNAEDKQVREAFKNVISALAPGRASLTRIFLEPYWFHELIHKGN